MVQRIVQMACGRNAVGTSEHRDMEEHGSLVQQTAAHKRSDFMDKPGPKRGTQSATTGVLLSNIV